MNIIVKYDESSIAVEGSAESLQELSRVLRETVSNEVISLQVPQRPATPYSAYIKSLRVQNLDANVCVYHTADELVISGSPEKLAILSRNIQRLANDASCAEHNKHIHIEYHADHFYLKKGSVPLVIMKLNSP